MAAKVVAGAPDDPVGGWLEAPQCTASIMWDGVPTNELMAWDLSAGEIAVIDAAIDDAVTRRDVMGFLLLVCAALLPERPVLSL